MSIKNYKIPAVKGGDYGNVWVPKYLNDKPGVKYSGGVEDATTGRYFFVRVDAPEPVLNELGSKHDVDELNDGSMARSLSRATGLDVSPKEIGKRFKP